MKWVMGWSEFLFLFAVIALLAYIVARKNIGKQKIFPYVFGSIIFGVVLVVTLSLILGAMDGAYWERDRDTYILMLSAIYICIFLMAMWGFYMAKQGIQSDHFLAWIIIAIPCAVIGIHMIGWALTNTFGANFLSGKHDKVDLWWFGETVTVAADTLGGIFAIFASFFLIIAATVWLMFYTKKRRKRR